MPKIVYVKWLDAATHRSERSKEDALSLAGTVVESAGVLLSHDREFVRFVLDSFPDHGTVRDVTVIPRKYITDMKIFDTDDRP